MLTFKDDIVANGTITLEQLIHYYKNGFRQFKNIILDLKNDIYISFPFLTDATFENCSVIHIQVGAQLNFSDNNETIIINGCDYYKDHPNELENTESLFSILNKKRIITQNKNTYRISASLFLDTIPFLKEKPRARIINRLDLSAYNTKGNDIIDYINAIDEFIQIDFSHCIFSEGVILPDFILNQIENKEKLANKLLKKYVSPVVMMNALRESKDSLLKIAKQLEQKSKTKSKYKFNDDFQAIKSGKSLSNLSDRTTFRMNLSGSYLEDQIRSKKNKYWRGCVVETPIQFSAQSIARIARVDFQNTVFKDTVDFSHTTLSGWNMSGVQFEKNIIIDEFSDFRGCRFSRCWKNDTQITYQIKNKSYELKGDAKKIYEALKKEYYRIRDSQKIKIFRSDFFETLERKIYPENEDNHDTVFGMRLLEVFNHIQKKRHILTGKKNSRTWEALRNIAIERVEHNEVFQPELVQKVEVSSTVQPISPLPSDHSDEDRETTNPHEEYKAECIKTLDSLFSSFHNSSYFFGSDDASDRAIEERTQNENRLIDMYLFLKKTYPETVTQYHELMNSVIYPNYLYYVVYRKRICDASGKQIRFFRYSLFEKLISVMDPEKKEKAISLAFLSRHREDIKHTFQFFSHESDLADEFKKYCLTEWANLPLKYYATVNCLSEKDIEHIQNQPTVMDQKNYLIAHLISSDIHNHQLLKTELNAFVLAFSSSQSHQSLLSAAIEDLTRKVGVELCELQKTGGEYYCWLDSVLRTFDSLRLDTHIDLQFTLYSVKNKIKSIESGILLCKIINQIHNAIQSGSPIYPYLVDSFSSCHDCSLVWVGDAISKNRQIEKWIGLKNSENRVINQIYSVFTQILANSTTVNEVQDGKKPIKLGRRLAHQFQNAIYHIDDVIEDLKKVVLITLQYAQIKPAAKLQTGFLSQDVFPENAVLNPEKNSFKFSALVGLQNVYEKSLLELHSGGCTVQVIANIFNRFQVCLNSITDLLIEKKEAHHNLFSNPSFLDHIHQAKAELIDSIRKWQTQHSFTLFLHHEQLTPANFDPENKKIILQKDKLKQKLMSLIQPIFDYMHNRVSQVNATIPDDETKIIGEDRSEFGAYESMHYLQFRMHDAAFQYRRVYLLQEKWCELQRHIDCMMTSEMDLIAEHVFDAMITALEDSLTEATQQSSHYFGLDDYGQLIESAISACKEEKKSWISAPLKHDNSVQI